MNESRRLPWVFNP